MELVTSDDDREGPSWPETWSWIERRILAFLSSSKLALLRFDHLRLLISVAVKVGEDALGTMGFSRGRLLSSIVFSHSLLSTRLLMDMRPLLLLALVVCALAGFSNKCLIWFAVIAEV